MSCFCHFLNNLIAHCFMDKNKSMAMSSFFKKLCMQTLIFILSNLINVKTVWERGKMQLSLAFLTLSPQYPFTCLHISHLLFPYQSPIYQTGRGAAASMEEWVMGLSFHATSKADIHISRWHLHTEPLWVNPVHVHTTLPTSRLLWVPWCFLCERQATKKWRSSTLSKQHCLQV